MGSPFQHYSGSNITDKGPSFQPYELGTTGNINMWSSRSENHIIGMGSPFKHYSGSNITDMGPSFQLYELGTIGTLIC
jgi:hypothetical protein